MDLQNMLKHMKGKSVCVNGNVYAIDMKGIAHKVKAKDAEKMMMGKAWDVVGSEPEIEGKEQTEGKELKAMADESEGDKEQTEGEEPTAPELDIKELKAMADELGVSYGPNIGEALLRERIEEATTKDPG